MNPTTIFVQLTIFALLHMRFVRND